LLAPATDNSELHVVAQRRQRSSKVFAGATGASCKAPRACTSVIAAGRASAIGAGQGGTSASPGSRRATLALMAAMHPRSAVAMRASNAS